MYRQSINMHNGLSFTPGIKKVIEFLKSSFDASITDVENKITF